MRDWSPQNRVLYSKSGDEGREGRGGAEGRVRMKGKEREETEGREKEERERGRDGGERRVVGMHVIQKVLKKTSVLCFNQPTPFSSQ